MILVESSVLMQAQRLPGSEVAEHLAALIASGEAAVTGPVIMEYLRGARSTEEFDFLASRIVSIDYLDVDQQTWVLAGRLNGRLIQSGQRLPNMDVVIAATAVRYDVPLFTLDGDFARIPELDLYEPPSMEVSEQ